MSSKRNTKHHNSIIKIVHMTFWSHTTNTDQFWSCYSLKTFPSTELLTWELLRPGIISLMNRSFRLDLKPKSKLKCQMNLNVSILCEFRWITQTWEASFWNLKADGLFQGFVPGFEIREVPNRDRRDRNKDRNPFSSLDLMIIASFEHPWLTVMTSVTPLHTVHDM